MRWPDALRRLQPASRDARDTLFMLAVIGWTLAPHLWHLPPWVGLLSLGVLVWRAWLAWHQRPLPGRLTLVGVLVLAAGLTLWSERTLLGRDAGLMLLVVLMALKTLELRARRDALVVFFLGFFLVLTNFLHSQSLLTALAMTVSVWGWLTALTLAHLPAGRPALAEAARLAGRAALVGTPVMLLLFLLFPRIGPLWSLPGANARTGLSDTLSLGQVAELATDDSIALRVRFEGERPPTSQLYFRGPVLSEYDGQQWRAAIPWPRTAAAPGEMPGLSLTGAPLDYTLTLEPLRLAWLPLLEVTAARPQATPTLDGLPPAADAAGQWVMRAPLAQRVRLTARAWPQASRDPSLPLMQQRRLVELPAGQHPRTLAWAAELRAQPRLREAAPDVLASAVLAHIRQAPFSYTLTPGTYEGDSIDEFWLDRRAGFCEHYAAAFVVVMRAMDVPARIVTGYQGADALPQEGQWIVRQSNAHAWAEYWQEGRGWVRADPTAAVAPERVDLGRRLAVSPGLMMGALQAVNPGLQLALRQWMETLDNRWNQWVLGYSRTQQLNLLEGLGLRTPDTADLLRVLVLMASAAGLAGALWAWRDSRRLPPWERLQGRIRRELARLGHPAAAHEDPGRWARRLRDQGDVRLHPLAEALMALQALRYGPQALQGAAADRQLSAWWRSFRAAARRLPAASASPGSPARGDGLGVTGPR